MRTLVIGGIEFMGRRIVELLLERDHEVTVLHRRALHDLGPRVKNLQADRADLPRVAQLLRQENVDAVFDLAYDWVQGTPASQVEAAARACGDRLQRYVFMSSIAAYPPGLDHREDDELAPDDTPVAYVQHKVSAERALFRMHKGLGFPAVTFRPPFMHGPRQVFYREQFFWDRLLDGRPIVLPDGGGTPMQWAFADDIARACVAAIGVPEAAGQAFNMGHVEPLTQRSFVEALARTSGVAPRFAPIPRAVIVAAGGQLIGDSIYFGDYLDLPPVTSVIEKAPRVLGVSPTPLDEALRKGFSWYQAQPSTAGRLRVRRPPDRTGPTKRLNVRRFSVLQEAALHTQLRSPRGHVTSVQRRGGVMRIGRAVSATTALLLTACSGDTGSRVIAPSSTPATRAVDISIVSGDNQEAKAGEPLREPLVVRVNNAQRRGVEGAAVSFEVSGAGGLNGKQAPGGGSQVLTHTGTDGTAQVILEPYDVGRISVTGRVEGTSLAPVTFSADATVVVVEFRPPDAAGAYAAFWGPCRCTRTLNIVTVPVGTPVEWVTPDPTPYTITSVSSPAGGAEFDSGTLGRSSRYRFVPTVPGTWEYADRFSGLRATVAAN